MSKHPDNSDWAPATLEVGGVEGYVFIKAYWDEPDDVVEVEYTKRDALRLIRKLVEEVERIEKLEG